MRDRHAIHPNDHARLARWRARWDAERAKGFMLIGGSDEVAGNKSCRASIDKIGDLSLALRLPDALAPGYGRSQAKTLTIAGIKIGDTADCVLRAIASNARPGARVALTWRFVRDTDFKPDGRLSAWRVCCTLREGLPEPAPTAGRPVLGVDINADHLALALVSADGNPLETWRLDLDLRGKSTPQRRAIVEAMAIQLGGIALSKGASIALEDLDFARKKREIGQARERLEPRQPGYARMLSALPYAALGTAIGRRAARVGVAVRLVNPAYTSLIGEVNWMRRYGLTRHQGAAVAIARRAQGYSERVNYVVGSRRRRNARPSPVDEGRHVWCQWAGIHRERRAAARAAHKAFVYPSGGRSPGSTGRGLPRGTARGCKPQGAGVVA
jgi:IS605 OrfB family transposase